MIRAFFGAVVAFFGVLLVGCGNTAATVPEPTPSPVQTSVSSSPTAPIPTPAGEDPAAEEENRIQRMQWAHSPERQALFEDYPKAGVIIAQALMDGKFGPATKYNGGKDEWFPGQSGWGGIYANVREETAYTKPSALVEVYWNADGTPDLSRGVRVFHIDMGLEHYGITYSLYEGEDGGTPHHVVQDTKTNNGELRNSTCFEYCEEVMDVGFVHKRTAIGIRNVEAGAEIILHENMQKLTSNPEWHQG